jgi:hypothetical protein
MAVEPDVAVYRLVTADETYQELLVDLDTDARTHWLQQMGRDRLSRFDGQQWSETWIAPPVYVMHPTRRRGDAFTFFGVSGTFAISAAAKAELGEFLWCAECLPVDFNGEELYLVNPFDVVNCIDQAASLWRSMSIYQPSFLRYRLPDSPLFRVPLPASPLDVYTVHRADSLPGEELIHKARGLSGLGVELVWDSVNGVVEPPQRW